VSDFVVEPLRRAHDRGAFDCGVATLDRYLRERALQDVERRVAGCFVALSADGEIAGFYTLAAASVPIGALPAEVAKRLPRYPAIPAMLLGRLAVAKKHQGKALGRALVADAIIRTDRLGVGAFALIVDAKDEAAARFYRVAGFLPLPDEKRRLFLPIATALKAMGEGR